jgi:hypothetical protein
MKANKIFWPRDFSSSAESALPYIQSLTEKYGSEIHVVHVLEDIAHHEEKRRALQGNCPIAAAHPRPSGGKQYIVRGLFI